MTKLSPILIVAFFPLICWETTASEKPTIHVPSQAVLRDQKIVITITGLKPHQKVKILFEETLNNQDWISHGVYKAGKNGTIDLSKVAPISGSYIGVDAMGLFWSAVPKAGKSRVYYFLPFDRPNYRWPVQLRAEINGKIVAKATLTRRWLDPKVQVIEINKNGLVGKFFLPPTPKPRPALLVFGGSGGGLGMQKRAALLASHGYPTLAVAYFRMKGLPDSLSLIPLEYFAKALDYLGKQPSVDCKRIGVCGASRGGELALLLSATFPTRIKATIAYVPSGVVWGSVGGNFKRSGWKWKGKPIPFMYRPFVPKEKYKKVIAPYLKDKSKAKLAWWYSMLAEEDLVRKATIPVEKINGPILLISGQKDSTWPSSYMSKMVVYRLKKHQYKYLVTHLDYPEAGHAILTPYQPTLQFARRGGTASGIAHAMNDSWRKVLEFLEKEFKVK